MIGRLAASSRWARSLVDDYTNDLYPLRLPEAAVGRRAATVARRYSGIVMRRLFAAIAMVALPAAGAAQSRTPVDGTDLPLPTIGLPLPEIGLPLPRIGLPPPVTKPAADRSGGPPLRPRRQEPLYPLYVLAPYPWLPIVDARPRTDAAARPAKGTAGSLILRVEPAVDGQVFVDGVYVGTSDAFGNETGQPVPLDAGTHVVQVLASGFEAVQAGVGIVAGRATTFRAQMKTSTAVADPVAAAAPPIATGARMRGYIIPGCYLGNVPPREASLPPGCDPDRAIAIQP